MRIRVELVLRITHGRKLVLKCTWQHVWEKLDRDGKQQLHERDNDKNGERNQAEQIVGCSFEL
jgi:hypothetical protein